MQPIRQIIAALRNIIYIYFQTIGPTLRQSPTHHMHQHVLLFKKQFC